jgi:hypothetical protein
MEASGSRPILRLGGLSVSVGTSAIIGSLLLWIILSLAGIYLLNFALPKALLLALAAVVLHWAGETLHQLGHAFAARSSGHPMVGIHFWGVLSSSRYPPDEPPLPRSVHVRRALGGPIFSLIITLLAIIPLLLLRAGTWAWWLALFFFLDNLLVFTIGAFLPLGFTDGSTLLNLYRNRSLPE